MRIPPADRDLSPQAWRSGANASIAAARHAASTSLRVMASLQAEPGMLPWQPLREKEVSQRGPVGKDVALSVRAHRQLTAAGGDADDASGIARGELPPELALSSGDVEPVDTDLRVVRPPQVEVAAIRAPLDRTFVAMQSLDDCRL